MFCMKCGREIEDGQVFCPGCLDEMERDPISIRSSVKIPRQPPRKNVGRRPVIHFEEEVLRLEKSNEVLRAWVILLALATILLSMAMYYKEVEQVMDDLGQNYSIIETSYGS